MLQCPYGVTTAAILQITGIQAVKTLTRWHQRGLIPPPVRKPHPSGMGKTGFWPAWVAPRCLEIQRLLATGLSLDDVHEKLGSDWVNAEKQWNALSAKKKPVPRKGHGFKDSEFVKRRKAEETFAAAVIDQIATITKLSSKRSELLRRYLTSEQAYQTLDDMMSAGFKPVALVDGDRVEILPDAAVSMRLHANCTKPLILLPLHELALQTFPKSLHSWPAASTVIPSAMVEIVADGKRTKRRLVAAPDGSFRLVRKRSRRQSSSLPSL